MRILSAVFLPLTIVFGLSALANDQSSMAGIDNELVGRIRQEFEKLDTTINPSYQFIKNQQEGGMWVTPSHILKIVEDDRIKDWLEPYGKSREVIYALWPYVSDQKHKNNAFMMLFAFSSREYNYYFDNIPRFMGVTGEFETLRSPVFYPTFKEKVKKACHDILKGFVSAGPKYDPSLLRNSLPAADLNQSRHIDRSSNASKNLRSERDQQLHDQDTVKSWYFYAVVLVGVFLLLLAFRYKLRS